MVDSGRLIIACKFDFSEPRAVIALGSLFFGLFLGSVPVVDISLLVKKY